MSLSIFKTELFDRYEEGSELSGVIYIHRISDNRFTETAGRNFRIFCELCGESALKNVVLVTNMWGNVSHEIGEVRENELSRQFFKPALDKGAKIVRHHNTVESAQDIVRRIVANNPVVLRIQWELADEQKDITETAAGEAVIQELDEQTKRCLAGLREVQEGIERPLRRATMLKARPPR